ncbi:dihydroxyacid dehydratase [Fusarium pseudocircinatum]|uniref:Dihydroxyacid dehydratase n=1 Tax=Fusarium pseudocircinatum TaxID=56676 RepID=A0A8H5PRF0_9HYPO|nr:dihydroxyacid dehydratase [Fusarium pseudocircinatum]
MNNPPQTHDLMIVFDAVTCGTFGTGALKEAISDIINFAALVNCFERIGVIAYRNYACTPEKVVEWSGWCYPSRDPEDPDPGYPSTDDTLRFVKTLEMPAANGYELNCASKTALAKAYQEMRSNGTIILLYTLAPPMLEHIRRDHYDLELYKSEQMTLPEYGEKGHLFRNWINGANTLAGLTSDKKAVVLSFSLGIHDNLRDWSPYLYLSVATGGELYRTNYTSVSRLTISLLLTWMQADGNIDIPQAFRTAYKGDPTLFHWACEANMGVFCGLNRGNLEVFDTHTTPRNRLRVPYGGASNNNQQLNRFTSENLAKTYIDSSVWYKNAIARHISRIIRTNVSVLAIHPIFQRLWVTVCMDRTGSKIKRTLKQKFEDQVLRISDDEDKRQAQAWLDEADTILHEIDEEI